MKAEVNLSGTRAKMRGRVCKSENGWTAARDLLNRQRRQHMSSYDMTMAFRR